MLSIHYVKDVGTKGSWPSATEFVAAVRRCRRGFTPQPSACLDEEGGDEIDNVLLNPSRV